MEKFNLIRGIAVGADPTASLIRIRPDVYEAEILEGEGWVSGAFVVRARPLNGFWALIVRIGLLGVGRADDCIPRARCR